MKNPDVMGRNEYARHQQVSPAAVNKAVRSGRITKAVVFGAGGRIDGIKWQLADQLWRQNTDPGEALKSRLILGPALPPSKQREMSVLLARIFTNCAIPWAALMVRRGIDREAAFDSLKDGVLIFNVAVCSVLGIDAGSCDLKMPEILGESLSPPARLTLLDQVTATAAQLQNEADD